MLNIGLNGEFFLSFVNSPLFFPALKQKVWITLLQHVWKFEWCCLWSAMAWVGYNKFCNNNSKKVWKMLKFLHHCIGVSSSPLPVFLNTQMCHRGMTYPKEEIYFSPSVVRWIVLLLGGSVSCCGAEDQELPTIIREPRCSDQTIQVVCVTAMRLQPRLCLL